MGIEFVLAVIDPAGQQTSGIVRYNMSGTSSYMNYGIKHYVTSSPSMRQVSGSPASLKTVTRYYSYIYVIAFLCTCFLVPQIVIQLDYLIFQHDNVTVNIEWLFFKLQKLKFNSSEQKLYIPGTIYYLYKGFHRSHIKSSIAFYTKDIVCERSRPDLFTDISLRKNWLFRHCVV